MDISVETTSKLGRRLNISVPVVRVDGEFDKRVKAAAKKAKIDGFRPGKVPEAEIKKRYAGSIRQEILNDLIQSSLYEALTQEKIQPVGMPKIDIKKYEGNQPLEYIVDLEIYPEIQLADVTQIEIEKVISEISDKDLDNMIEVLRQQRVQWKTVSRVARNGDQVIIDFDGFIDGQPLEGGKAEKTPLVLGSHAMIPGFEEGIIGMNVNEEKEINVAFPKDYGKQDLAGKNAIFKIKIHEVRESKLPEVNDDFIKALGIQNGGLEKLREELKKTMLRELDTALKAINKIKVMDKLFERNKFELPNALIETEINALHQQAIQRAQQYSKTKEVPDIPKESFKAQAEKRVALGLIIAEYIKINQAKPDAAQVQQAIEELTRFYPKPQEMVKEIYANKQQLASVEMVVMEDQIVDKLLGSAKVKERPMQYDEVMQKRMDLMNS